MNALHNKVLEDIVNFEQDNSALDALFIEWVKSRSGLKSQFIRSCAFYEFVKERTDAESFRAILPDLRKTWKRKIKEGFLVRKPDVKNAFILKI